MTRSRMKTCGRSALVLLLGGALALPPSGFAFESSQHPLSNVARLDGETRPYPSQSEIDAAKRHVEQRMREISFTNACPVTRPDVQRDAAGGSLASMASKLMIAEAVSTGVFRGIDYVLSVFGGNSDAAILSALGRIQQSLNALHAKVDAILFDLKRLMDAQTRNAFETAQQQVDIPAANITQNLWIYQDWRGWADDPECDFTPSVEDTRAFALATIGYLADLQGALVGSAGGAVPKLLLAASVEAEVTNLESHWEQVQFYRDRYEASLAQALIALHGFNDLVPGAQIGAYLPAATRTVEETIDIMYAMIGVPYFQMLDGPNYVHLQYADWIVSDWFYSRYRDFYGDAWEGVSDDEELDEIFAALSAGFDATAHGGLSLEEYLHEQGWHENHSPRLSNGDDIEIDADQAAARMPVIVMDVEVNYGGRAANFDEEAIRAAKEGVAGFAFERPEEGTVDVTIPTDFGIYNRLQFVDEETGNLLAQFTDEENLESFVIDANGEPDRLIVVQQGRWETPRNRVPPPPPWGWPNAEQGQLNVWARSGFTIDGTQSTFVRINGGG